MGFSPFVDTSCNKHSRLTWYLISLALASLPVCRYICEKNNLQKFQQKMFFVESKQVKLDNLDQKEAQFLKILQEKNVKFYFFSQKTK